MCDLQCAYPSRWWGVCVQRDSVGNSVGTLQIYVEASPASEECSADQSLASSPAVNVLITLSLMGKKDTSALKVVCRFFFTCHHIITF